QFLRVGDLVARREIGTERRKCIGALALETLPAAIELEIALGKINADAIAEDMIQRIALGDVDTGPPDDDTELNFPIDALRLARNNDVVIRSAQCARCLEEQGWLFRQGQARFLGVIAVVQSHADDLADTAQRRAERDALLYVGKRFHRQRSDRVDVIKRRRAQTQGLKAAAEIENFTVQKETGSLAGCGAV